MVAPLILIVEDEAPLSELLRYNLEKVGYRVQIAASGEDALHWVDVDVPDLAVVDWMLPDLSGIEFVRVLRSRTETKKLPIIMLTARGEESDRVLGFESGVDDYVVKPYSPREMIARVRAQLRRNDVHNAVLVKEYAGVTIDLEAHRVKRNDKPVHLSPTCFKLLETLMERPEYVYSRERLLNRVWGRDVYVEARTVDVHIRRLRQALEVAGAKDIIRTVRGAGYALDQNKI